MSRCRSRPSTRLCWRLVVFGVNVEAVGDIVFAVLGTMNASVTGHSRSANMDYSHLFPLRIPAACSFKSRAFSSAASPHVLLPG